MNRIGYEQQWAIVTMHDGRQHFGLLNKPPMSETGLQGEWLAVLRVKGANFDGEVLLNPAHVAEIRRADEGECRSATAGGGS